jgi:DNA-binding transcriptional MerR regulator
VTRYSRQDVLRILQLKASQLAAWERVGLFPTLRDGESYTFEHLSRLRNLREIKHKRISARSIRRQFDAMQKVSGMSNALVETSAVRRGSRLVFRHGGALVDPLTNQLAFDFATVNGRQLQVARSGAPNQALAAAQVAAQLQEMFLHAVQLEESPATLPKAVAVYESILTERPRLHQPRHHLLQSARLRKSRKPLPPCHRG